jgi:hypothetical protein
MQASLGLLLLAGSAGLAAATAVRFRTRVPAGWVDRLFAAAGAGLGLGALLVQHGVGILEWVFVPIAIGALLPVHARLLFAGGGPFRTEGEWTLSGAYPVPNPREQQVTQTFEGTEDPDPLAVQAAASPFVDAPPLEAPPLEPPAPAPTGTFAVGPRATAPELSRRERRAQVRRTRVVVRHVGPISVLKLSLIFYFCIWLIVFFGLLIAFGIASSLGVVGKTAEFWGKLFSDAGENFKIDGQWIFTRLFLIGSGMVAVLAILNLIVTFLYNLISDVVGGLEVTLSEKR